MRKTYWIIPALSSLLMAGACGGNEEGETITESPAAGVVAEESQMYEASELASLMRQMYEDNDSLRTLIMSGEVPASFPEDFYTIHTAQATDPDEINETFHALAEEYMKNMEAIIHADKATVVAEFNNMVNTCVSCHQIYCQGPIPKIRKLTIPDEA